MNIDPAWLLLAGLLGVSAAAVAIRSRADRRRRDSATPVLNEEGFIVNDAVTRLPRYPFPEFDRLIRTTEYQITRPDAPDTAFQYDYTDGFGRHAETTRLSCAIVPLGFASPPIAIRRGAETVAERMTGNRVESESAEFNRRYVVRSTDERAAFTLLSYEVIEWFLSAHQLAVDTTFRLAGSTMLVATPQIDEVRLPELLDVACSLEAAFPDVMASLYPATSTPARRPTT